MEAEPHGPAAERVQRHVAEHAQAAMATLEELLRIPSVAGRVEQNACQDVIRAQLAPGVEIDDWVPDWDAVAAFEAPIGRRLFVPVGEERGPEHAEAMAQLRCLVASVGSGSPHLVINGHIDVVPAVAEEWSSAPYEPVMRDGRLYARGSIDMKAGVVAALLAFNAVAELGLLPAGRLSLAVVPEEESGGNGTLACIERGHVGDGAIFAERSGLAVAHRHVGIQSIKLEAHGREGAMLKRGNGASAIEAMARAIVALERVAAVRTERAQAAGGYDECDDPGFTNVGIVRGGDWPATRAGHCRAQGLFGVLPGETLDAAEDELRRAVADAVADHAGTRVEVSFGQGGHPGGELPADHALVRALQGAGEDLGMPIPATRAGAMVCDAKILHGGGWAPAVVFGPTGDGLHAADEYVEVDSILRSAEALALAAVRYCAGE